MAEDAYLENAKSLYDLNGYELNQDIEDPAACLIDNIPYAGFAERK